MLLYYITDRTQFPGNENARRRALLEKIAEAASCGIDFIQLREKDLSTRDLEVLAHAAVETVRRPRAEKPQRTTRLLINSRTDVAIASGADGVHLRSQDISPRDVRAIWARSAGGSGKNSAVIGVSCHSVADVAQAAAEGADFAVFAPVFEKVSAESKGAVEAHPAGLDALREACLQKIPVLALGGVTAENAGACLEAGAAGMAGIRLFQNNDIAEVVRRLRG